MNSLIQKFFLTGLILKLIPPLINVGVMAMVSFLLLCLVDDIDIDFFPTVLTFPWRLFFAHAALSVTLGVPLQIIALTLYFIRTIKFA